MRTSGLRHFPTLLVCAVALLAAPELSAKPRPESPPKGRPEVPEGLKQHASAIPSCPEGTQTCIGIRFFVARSGGKAVVTPEWLSAHVDRANLLLASLGVAFQLYSIDFLPKNLTHIRNRGDRDRLGAQRWQRGFIHVFVGETVKNVDDKGNIYGVHWRWRANKSRRWIILSAESWPMTLVHELGHFFGLPHNDIMGSIMNKTGQDPTPIADRRFTVEELEIVKKGLEAKLTSKELLPQIPQLPPLPE